MLLCFLGFQFSQEWMGKDTYSPFHAGKYISTAVEKYFTLTDSKGTNLEVSPGKRGL
jgi:hypothetical protein